MYFYQHSNAGRAGHVDPALYENFFYAMHLHADLELVWLRRGTLTLRLRDREEALEAGMFALILPHELHAYATPGRSEAFVCVFSGDYVPAFLHALGGRRGRRSAFQGTDALRAMVGDAFFADGAPGELEMKAVFYAVCARFLREVPLEEGPGAGTDALEMLIRYVEENFREDISMDSAARALGYSRSYLSRQFHQAMGINFRSFINCQRVQYVVHQMRAGAANISELALASGFQNLRSFNRAFKAMMGDAPRAFLRNEQI